MKCLVNTQVHLSFVEEKISSRMKREIKSAFPAVHHAGDGKCPLVWIPDIPVGKRPQTQQQQASHGTQPEQSIELPLAVPVEENCDARADTRLHRSWERGKRAQKRSETNGKNTFAGVKRRRLMERKIM